MRKIGLVKRDVFAVTVIVVFIGLYYQAVWRPGLVESMQDSPPSLVVAPDSSVELYGVTWRMREILVPDSDSDSDSGYFASPPQNGRVVAFLFERSRNGQAVTQWSRTEYPPCLTSVVDDRMRRWRSGVFPSAIDKWASQNGYLTQCAQESGSGQFVLIATVPAEAHLMGADVLFRESDEKESIVRFKIT